MFPALHFEGVPLLLMSTVGGKIVDRFLISTNGPTFFPRNAGYGLIRKHVYGGWTRPKARTALGIRAIDPSILKLSVLQKETRAPKRQVAQHEGRQ